jgi:hypothetical protein
MAENTNFHQTQKTMPKWWSQYQQRRAHRATMRNLRREIEQERGHKLTGRQWVRERRAVALQRKEANA